jgi:hypothetical protein
LITASDCSSFFRPPSFSLNSVKSKCSHCQKYSRISQMAEFLTVSEYFLFSKLWLIDWFIISAQREWHIFISISLSQIGRCCNHSGLNLQWDCHTEVSITSQKETFSSDKVIFSSTLSEVLRRTSSCRCEFRWKVKWSHFLRRASKIRDNVTKGGQMLRISLATTHVQESCIDDEDYEHYQNKTMMNCRTSVNSSKVSQCHG